MYYIMFLYLILPDDILLSSHLYIYNNNIYIYIYIYNYIYIYIYKLLDITNNLGMLISKP